MTRNRLTLILRSCNRLIQGERTAESETRMRPPNIRSVAVRTMELTTERQYFWRKAIPMRDSDQRELRRILILAPFFGAEGYWIDDFCNRPDFQFKKAP